MNTRRSRLAGLALVLLAAVPLRAQDIDQFVTGWMEKQRVPAVAIAVIKDGSLIKAEGYGLADMEHGVRARADTVFKIGSVSKQFIAAGIMLLVQDGRIAVDDRVSKHLEGTPATWEAITVRHLLTHTSGLVREAPAFAFDKPQSDIDVIRSGYPAPLRFAPGEKYEYSNLGYFVLAEIIRRASGKPWSDFLDERVFTPLGMTATRPTSVRDLVPNRARGYAWIAGKHQNAEDGPAVRPSGAFLSTALDLAKWEAALLGSQILSDATKKQIWTRVALIDGRTFPYGFGWQLDDWPADSPVPTGVPMIRHGGSMGGFRAGYTRWPSHRLTVIVLTNLSNAPYEGLTANIAIQYVPALRTTPQLPRSPK